MPFFILDNFPWFEVCCVWNEYSYSCFLLINVSMLAFSPYIYLFKCFNVLIYFWERQRERERESKQGRGRERGRYRIWSRLQALGCQHRAQCRAQTHKLWDHDPSQCQLFNQLSHPGTPSLQHFFRGFCFSLSHKLTWPIPEVVFMVRDELWVLEFWWT